jgi:hypothetical protein
MIRQRMNKFKLAKRYNVCLKAHLIIWNSTRECGEYSRTHMCLRDKIVKTKSMLHSVKLHHNEMLLIKKPCKLARDMGSGSDSTIKFTFCAENAVINTSRWHMRGILMEMKRGRIFLKNFWIFNWGVEGRGAKSLIVQIMKISFIKIKFRIILTILIRYLNFIWDA